jgi:uncharacterized membrane protein YhaH (DUF805 family)
MHSRSGGIEVNFGQAVSTVFKKYAQFRGVASRSEYWWWTLFGTVVGYAIIGIDTVVNVHITGVAYIWGLVIFLPTLAVTVRRLRDAGYRWTVLFLELIPFLGVLIVVGMLCLSAKDDAAVIAAREAN